MHAKHRYTQEYTKLTAMNGNPLTAPITRILRNNPEGLSEYELLRQLEFDGLQLDQEPGVSPGLLLFRKHFLLMNALYRLRPVLQEEGYYLTISALKVELQPITGQSAQGMPGETSDHALRDYYLDWSQFDQSSNASVEQLFNDFWERYFAEDKKLEALAVLQLADGCSWPQIRMAYRRLAALHHPDRGGEAEEFAKVREAYELLACCMGGH